MCPEVSSFGLSDREGNDCDFKKYTFSANYLIIKYLFYKQFKTNKGETAWKGIGYGVHGPFLTGVWVIAGV